MHSAVKVVILSLLLSLQSLGQIQPTLENMSSKRVRLSHVDPIRCIEILKLYGFHIGVLGQAVDPAQLPVILPLPGTTLYNTVQSPGTDLPLTESDPLNELIVFYDSAEPQQLSRLIHTIENIIDIPARQIIIEAMILEITEKSLDQLGVEWEMMNSSNPLQALTAGQLPQDADFLPTLNMTANDVFGEFGVKLQALVESGKAEILSRPSILTLNNRMAYINVSQQIPVAEGKLNSNGELTSIEFKEKMAGIQLGVRPRISKNEREVGMQISASVTALVANEDVELKNSDGDITASSPTISVREVKTYARIANNMPFIIGGLVAKDDVQAANEVPWLGKLPYIGRLFRNETVSHQKREVIIIITPYILPEKENVGTQIGEKSITLRTVPKDDKIFDSFGNHFFRNSYRIRSTDVLSLEFLTENEQLVKMQQLADEAVSHNVLLKNDYPWNQFADSHVPGEEILVFRQIYGIIKRSELDKSMTTEKIAFLGHGHKQDSGFHGRFLDEFVETMAKRYWAEDHLPTETPRHNMTIWDRLGDRAIALVYTSQNQSTDPENMLSEPAPEIKIVDCADGEDYDDLLWEYNQPDEAGYQRHAVLLSSDRDLKRLKRAFLLRQTVELNATQKSMTLNNFTVGQNLLLPGMDERQINLIDSEVAQYYFYSEQHYRALRQQLVRDIQALKNEVNGTDNIAPLPSRAPSPTEVQP